MPIATLRGAAINYEILGTRGPAMALTPGGRNPLANVRSMAERMAAAGFRVLIHDRRNCGASDVAFDPTSSEYDVSADDLHELLGQHEMLPAILGGASSGARLALAFALRHGRAVRALILWRVTGGPFAVRRLVDKYYGEYIAAAEGGGMAAVCATEHFAEMIRNRPSNRDRLMAMDPEEFIAVMKAWREHFVASADLPLIGASTDNLRTITVPACLIPGDDLTHAEETGRNAARLMPDCELHVLTSGTRNIDVAELEEWRAREGAMTAIFTEFLARRLAPATARRVG
jgi:pimeloyl-ACP methyl ester carboxylesterase